MYKHSVTRHSRDTPSDVGDKRDASDPSGQPATVRISADFKSTAVIRHVK